MYCWWVWPSDRLKQTKQTDSVRIVQEKAGEAFPVWAGEAFSHQCEIMLFPNILTLCLCSPMGDRNAFLVNCLTFWLWEIKQQKTFFEREKEGLRVESIFYSGLDKGIKTQWRNMNTEIISSALSRGLWFCLLAEKPEAGPTTSSGFLMGSQCWSQCHPLFMLLINYSLVLDNSLDMMHGLMGCKIIGHLFIEYGIS